jgi:hypothetical protein
MPSQQTPRKTKLNRTKKEQSQKPFPKLTESASSGLRNVNGGEHIVHQKHRPHHLRQKDLNEYEKEK